jgi:hypothetical protein
MPSQTPTSITWGSKPDLLIDDLGVEDDPMCEAYMGVRKVGWTNLVIGVPVGNDASKRRYYRATWRSRDATKNNTSNSQTKQ